MLRTIDLYEQLSFFEGSKDFASELEALYQQLASVKKSLDQRVIGLVNDLQTQIMNDKLPSKRGFFTRIHNWWKNLFGGDNSRSNPYYWQNKIGALGRTDLEPPTVREYAMLKDLSDALWEDTSAAPQPLIRKILNNWTARLRQTIASSLDDMMGRVRSMASRVNQDDTPTDHQSSDVGSESKPDDAEPESDAEPDSYDTVSKEMFAARKKFFDLRKKMDKKNAWAALDEKERKLLAPMLKNMTRPSSDAGEDAGEDTGSEETLDKQAEKYDIFRDTRTDFGVWGKLDDSTKRLILMACKSGSCLKDEPAENNYPIKEIHATTQRYLELFHQKKRKTEAWAALTAREQEILKAIHQSWNKLPGPKRNVHNNRGNNGKRIKNRSQNGPFTLPKVLRIDDPRHEILKKYYPQLFQHLDLAGRVERPVDTEASVQERIEKLLRKDREEGFSTEDEKKGSGVRDREEIHEMPDEEEVKEKKKTDLDDVRIASTRDEDDDLDDNPDIAAVEERLYEPRYEEFATKLTKVVKTDRELVRKLLDTWDHISDSRTLRSKFLKLVNAGKYKDIQAMSSENKKKKTDEDDDEAVRKHLGESFKQKMRAVSERVYRES